MARIRTIKPDFWTDEKIVELSPLARLLFLGLLNFCDDDGRMQFSKRKIKMQIFPAEHTDLSGEFGEIRGASLINIYVVDNIEYLHIINFNKHQKIDKRTHSKLPPPPTFPEDSTNPPDGREGNGIKAPSKKGTILNPETHASTVNIENLADDSLLTLIDIDLQDEKSHAALINIDFVDINSHESLINNGVEL